jgi:RNA polymerase sigma factor (sigma-70 family)
MTNTTSNPLSSDYLDSPGDAACVLAAVRGDKQALEELVRRHQGFVHSLARRMLYSPEDAADATQEILIQIVTSLASFRGEASFRTWAYRIAVRHLLACKKSRVENVVKSFGCFAQTLDATPDLDPPDEGTLPVDVRVVIEEAKVGCLMAMLLCLDRDHRMAFVLGEIFEASDVVAAEVLGITRDNFRQRLTRAREHLRQFLTGRCGLIDAEGACHCARKTKGFIAKGIVDPARLRFTQVHLDHAKEQAIVGVRDLERHVELAYAQLLRSQPQPEPLPFAEILRDVLALPEVRRTLDLES